ncbi:hypothetical protein PGT21_030656 [Puccinia graminis f. sp. tritici]|uniref:Uncharacterized protein n=1 Tax=Puccinia graminis f. sp. tritici TaxID=56615 RepID=A0A5B0M7A4_PUCGR|nr:hypothetical protein PGT21_030656 [Puccinia graminis f. sp. tritici]
MRLGFVSQYLANDRQIKAHGHSHITGEKSFYAGSEKHGTVNIFKNFSVSAKKDTRFSLARA